MDDKTFDSWTRARATTNRRSLLGWSLTTGIGAALTRLQPAAAQFDGGQAGTCTWPVTLTSSLDTGQTASGTLVVDIGEDGAIDSGSLTLGSRAPASVVGQATGSGIALLASLSDGTTLSLTGIGDSRIDGCANRITGFLANAGTGQLGTWRTQSNGGGSGQSSAAQGGGQSSGGSQSQSGTQSQEQTQPGGACLELHSQCNASAECCSGWCTNNECRTCGNTICGEDCIVLSDNLAHCGQCFNACNTDTQTCVNGTCTGDQGVGGGDGGGGGGGCVDFGGGCNFGGQCCSGFCNGGTCGSCGGVVCNEMCVDTSSDNNNCGNCNNMCIGTTCQNGSCQ